MNKFTSSLQQHPVIVLIMFILTVLSAIITIALGWETFYESFLAKEVKAPVWFIFILALVIFTGYILKQSRPKQPTELTTVEGKEFGVQQIEMDGKRFVNCRFDGSELVFRGKNGFGLEHNTFDNPPRISFQDHAAITLSVMKALNDDPNFSRYIQETFRANA